MPRRGGWNRLVGDSSPASARARLLRRPEPMPSGYSVVAITLLAAVGLGLLALAAYRPDGVKLEGPPAWKTYRFGFTTYALIFVAFDMEMIFMYPWAVVFAEIGLKAFLDMLVFICLLGGGIAYAWGMKGLAWE
jgi:NADH-quinone oxidoreductase subunit A